MFSSGPTFSKADLSSSLSASKHRFKLHHDAIRNKTIRTRSEISTLLLKKSYDLARIRAESLISLQWQLEAEEVLMLMCELLKSRIDLLCNNTLSSSSSSCPIELRESVLTLIFAANRTDIDELKDVKTQLRLRFRNNESDKILFEYAAKGDDFTKLTGVVNQSVIDRLCIGSPWQLEHLYEKMKDLLIEIATENGITSFDPKKDLIDSKIGYGMSGTSSSTSTSTSNITTGISTVLETSQSSQNNNTGQSGQPSPKSLPQHPHPDSVLPPLNGYTSYVNTPTVNNNTSNWTMSAPPNYAMSGGALMSTQLQQQQQPQMNMFPIQGQQQPQTNMFPFQPTSSGNPGYLFPSQSSFPMSLLPTTTPSGLMQMPIAQPQIVYIDPNTGQPHYSTFPMQGSLVQPMSMQMQMGTGSTPFTPYIPIALPTNMLTSTSGGGYGYDTNLLQQQQQQFPSVSSLGMSLPPGSMLNGSGGGVGGVGVGVGGGLGGGASLLHTGTSPFANQGFHFGGPTQSFPTPMSSHSGMIEKSIQSSNSSSIESVLTSTLAGVGQGATGAGTGEMVSTTETTLTSEHSLPPPRSARAASFRRSLFIPVATYDDTRRDLKSTTYIEDDEKDEEEEPQQPNPTIVRSTQQQQQQQSLSNDTHVTQTQAAQTTPSTTTFNSTSTSSTNSSSTTSVSDLHKRLAALRSN
jgi:hypothetical protein